MVDITLAAGGLETGSTGDDAVTFKAAIAGTNDGGGGVDSAILSVAADNAINQTGTTFTTATGIWALTSGATLQNGFTSLTTSEGTTFLSDTASSGILPAAAAATIDITDGSYQAQLFSDGLSTYTWSEAAGVYTLTVTALLAANYTVVSVDGTAVSGLTTFPTADGAGTLTFVSDDDMQFTPNTALLAGAYNVGDVVEFTYDVVYENNATGVQSTVTQTFSVEIAWTGGDDVFVGEDAALAGLTITDGDNTSTGLANNDAGDDEITGAGGNDILAGGAGSDTVLGSDGDDTITDTSAAASGDTNILGGGSGDDTVTAGADGDKVRGGGGDDILTGGAGVDAIQGGSGDDVIVAAAGNDTVRGGDGDDTIDGVSGNNELRGGDGDDTITAGSGDDVIFTSLGDADAIILGAGGNDTIVVKSGTGNTNVTGFAAGAEMDITAFTGFASAADIMASSYETSAGDLVIIFDATTSITLLAGSDAVDSTLNLDNTMFEFA